MGQMLEQTIEVIGELRELLVEARGVLKDIRHEVKEAKQLKKDLHDLIEKELDKEIGLAIDLAVKENADRFNADIKAMHNAATERIIESFQELTNTLLYGNKNGRGENALEDLMRSRGLIK